MAAALPHNVQLKLEMALSQWRQWRCDPPLESAPEALSVLGEGVSNHSVLVGAERRWVVRIDGIDPVSNGLNRQTEWRTLLSAHAAGLAPGPRYFNPELGCMVSDYLEPDLNQQRSVADIASLLRNIHQLPARHHRLDLTDRIRRYEKQLSHRGGGLPAALAAPRQGISSLLEQGTGDTTRAVLCHNDLLQANRLSSDGALWALDWEYSAMGSAWFELAVIIVGDAMSPSQADSLLEHYLDRAPTAAEKLAQQQHCCIYRYLEILWYLSLDRPDSSQGRIEEKIAPLTQALAELGAQR